MQVPPKYVGPIGLNSNVTEQPFFSFSLGNLWFFNPKPSLFSLSYLWEKRPKPVFLHSTKSKVLLWKSFELFVFVLLQIGPYFLPPYCVVPPPGRDRRRGLPLLRPGLHGQAEGGGRVRGDGRVLGERVRDVEGGREEGGGGRWGREKKRGGGLRETRELSLFAIK